MTNRNEFLAKIFGLALTLNLIWENLHAPLYTAVDPLLKIWPGLLLPSLVDAATVCLLAWAVLGDQPVFSPKKIFTLLFTGALTAAVFEIIGLWLGLWQYRPAMPTILGLGLSPLLQLALLTPLSAVLAGGLFARRKV